MISGGTVSCSQPTDYQILKMGVYDGVYQLDMSQADPNWAALHKEMGIPEADTKAMISGGNVHTMTVMENKDGSFTTSTNNTVVPHLNGGQLLEGESRLLEGFPEGGRLLRDGDGEGHVPSSSTVDATDDRGCLEGTDQERRSCHEVESGQDKGSDGGENVWREDQDSRLPLRRGRPLHQ